MGKAKLAKRRREPDVQVQVEPRPRTPYFIISLLLVISVLAVYWQAGQFEFVDFDDPVYVSENPHVKAGLNSEGVKWAMAAAYAQNWHPLTWISHMLDYSLFGADPGKHHLTAVFLHAANSVLLFLLLSYLTGSTWRGGIVAGLFALHPQHVESVAWISERKDVLSTLLLLLTVFSYAWYVKKPGVGRYALVMVMFTLGLMAKPMLVTLPLLLLLIDLWPLKRTGSCVQHLVIEKIPLLLLSGISAMLTVWAQKKGAAVASLDVLPLGVRIANALMSSVVYLVKMVWPVKLAGYYPHPVDSLPQWQVAGSGLILVCTTFLAILLARRIPYLTFGWFWYLITLAPVIGIMQVGMQARADRYTYVPLLGIFIILAWGVPDLFTRFSSTKQDRNQSLALGAVSVTILIAFAACSYVQASYWKDSRTFYSRAVSVTDRNWFALNGLGSAYMEQGKVDEAIECFREAVEIMPGYSAAQNNLGRALAESGNNEEAAKYYEEALRVDSNNPNAYNNLANSLLRQGKVDEAIEYYRKSLELDPDSALTHFNLALTLHQNGRADEAARHYEASLRLDPDNADAHNNLGLILTQRGKFKEAIVHYEKALEINPELQAARDNIELARSQMQGR